MKKLLAIVLTLSLLCCYAIPCAYAENTATGDFFETEPVEEDLLSEEPAEELPAGSGVEIENATAEEALIGDVTAEEIQPELPEEEIDVIPKIKYQREALVLKALGIMETDDYNQTVTRAEFVASVVTLCGYSNEASVATAYFSDVPKGHEYEGAVAYAAGINLVQGDGSNFRPDEPVTAEEAGIILLRALGHDNFSPYVTVDIVKARREGIYDGVSAQGNNPLTFDVAAKLIYNAMNLEMILVRGTTSDGIGSALKLEKDGTTLLNYYQKIYMTEGRVTDNGFTSYSGETTVSDMCVKIDNNIYEKGNIDLSDLLGHEVEAYYNDENMLLYVYDITDENDIRYIAAEDILFAELGVYQYELENGKIRTVSYAVNANIVYNGKALKPGEYKDELLCPQIGGVKIIRTNGADYNLVVITSQFNCTIKSIKKTDRGYMYVDVASKDKNISFNVDDIGGNVFIKDKYGSSYEVSEIVPYNVLSVAKSIDGNLLSITVSNNRGNGIISALTSGANAEVTIEGVQYRLTNDADMTPVRVGDFGWFYLDVYGNIAHFRSYAEYEERYGYLLKAWVINDDDDVFAAKIFDESGLIIICMAEKRLMVDGAVVKSSGFNTLAERFYSGTDFQPCMIRFELNMDGSLISLDTYQNRETDDSLRKMEAPIAMETRNTGIYDGMRRYRSNTYQFDGGLIIDSNTKIFAVPVGPHDDEDYKMIHMSTFQSNGYYDVEMYSTDSKSAVAEAMILYYAPKYDENTRNSKGYIRMPSFSTSYMQTGLVTDSQLIVDKNGDCVREITFLRFRNGQYYEYTLRWDDISDIEVGDVIRYYVLGDKIIDAEVVFDCNTKTVGTPRQISSNINTYVVRNNNCELADSSTTAANTKVINVSWMLSIMNAVSIHDGVLTGTLSEPSSTIEEADTRRAILGTICSGVYKYNSKAKTLTKSSVDEIVCFEETQGECSKLLVQFQGAQTTAIIILE